MKVILLCGIIYLVAFLITVLLIPLVIKFAFKINALDVPKDDRRVHTKPIPRIGGIAIFIGITVSILVAIVLGAFQPGVIDHITGYAHIHFDGRFLYGHRSAKILGTLFAGGIIFIVGFIDDLKDLPAKVKLVAQICAASLVYFMGIRIEFINFHVTNNLTYFSGIVSFIVTVLWIVAITNTINLVDGLDGLATGVTAIAALCIAYVGYIFGFYAGALPMLAIAGGALGFLIYNFYPAKIFMGDCGSQYLGFMLASFSILGTVKGATLVAVIIPGLALSLPIFDTLFAIIRRKINKRPVMQADKGHIHHRLLKAGLGQRRTVLLIYGVCGIMGIAAVLFSRGLLVETAGLLAIAAVYLYVVLTDANRIIPKIKEDVDKSK